MEGLVLGNFRVVQKIGAGGMGAVYLAEHQLLGSKAAVKVLLPELSRDAEVVSRFFQEAKAAASIRHPGLVNVFDYGKDGDDRAYIIMEFLEGESLAGRLRRDRRLSIELAYVVTRQLAGAVGAAHQRNIVHRDLKPDNAFLLPDAEMPMGVRVKVLDFGIAKLAHEGSAGMTRTGTLMGTPLYMSPEQCRGAALVDRRADVYSLGCILYEMVVGRPPFLGEGPGEIIAKHIYEAPTAPRAVDPQLPQGVEAVILRSLAKRPEERYQGMDELVLDLDRWVRPASMPQLGVSTTPAPTGGTAIGTAPLAGSHPPAGTPSHGQPSPYPPTPYPPPQVGGGTPAHGYYPTPPPTAAPNRFATPQPGAPGGPELTPPGTYNAPMPRAATPMPGPSPVPSSAAVAPFGNASTTGAPARSSRGWMVPVVLLVLAAGGVGIYLAVGRKKHSGAVAGNDTPDAAVAVRPAGPADAGTPVAAVVPDAAPVLKTPPPADESLKALEDAAALGDDVALARAWLALPEDHAGRKRYRAAYEAAAKRWVKENLAEAKRKARKHECDAVRTIVGEAATIAPSQTDAFERLASGCREPVTPVVGTTPVTNVTPGSPDAGPSAQTPNTTDPTPSQLSLYERYADEASDAYRAGDYPTAFAKALSALREQPDSKPMLSIATITSCHLAAAATGDERQRLALRSVKLGKFLSGGPRQMAAQICGRLGIPLE